uniref:CARD domain-containing protein n=1 Tax=Oncorhynchus kisutch TaxID=8019 RepID=A0A8C7IEC2_ONCKI
ETPYCKGEWNHIANPYISLVSLVSKVRKSNKMNRLPLMIFRRFHSRDSQLHNKSSFSLTLSGIPAEEFLKQHRAELIQGVKNTMPIADDLLSKSMIGDEEYSRIKAETTEQERMRELLNAVLPKGPEVMGACLKALSEHERHLVKYLRESR